MIIGDGDIASALQELPELASRDKWTLFASGVSNSQLTDPAEFRREIDLLAAQDNKTRVVYFSSLSVFYSNTAYAKHKRSMEALVKKYFWRSTIVRLGNIDWGVNPHTLINYLKAHPEAEIRDEYRFITSKEEFLFWMNMLPPWNCEFNITGKRMTIKEIKDEYASNNT